jgi:hypothetical protein
LHAFQKNGLIHLNTIYNLRLESANIRDDAEGKHQLTINAPDKFVAHGNKIAKDPRAISKVYLERNTDIPNTFVFCTSLLFNMDICSKLGYKDYYEITDAFKFAETLVKKLQIIMPMSDCRVSTVSYADKELVVNEGDISKFVKLQGSDVWQIDFKKIEEQYRINFWNVCFTKHKRFQSEQELRMIFVPRNRDKLTPFNLACPELRKYCKFSPSPKEAPEPKTGRTA